MASSVGGIWKRPIARRYYDVLRKVGGESVTGLEIGAGDRRLKKKMAGYWGEFDYRSCDIDTRHEHDFSEIDSVTGEFDLIWVI